MSKIGTSDLRNFAAELDGAKRLKRPEAKDKLNGSAKASVKGWLDKHDKARVYEAKLKGQDVFIVVHPKSSVGMVKEGDLEAFDKSGKLLAKAKAIIKDDTDQFDE